MLASDHSLNSINMRCIVIDDEEFAIDYMVSLISSAPTLELVSTFTDPTQALSFLNDNQVDLVFIDIQMPTMTGIEFIQMADTQQKYIITSAYTEYAIQGFDLEIIDFLSKPFPFERFLKAVNKAQHVIENIEVDPVIFVKSEGKLKSIKLADICWIESFRNSITINTQTNQFNLSLTISDFERRLPNTLFTRVHKSYIIANSHIDVVYRDNVSVRCTVPVKLIPIGEFYRKKFSQVIEDRVVRKPTK